MISKLKNKEFLWNTFGQLIQMIGAIVIMKLLAMYLSKGEYGKLALINSLLALFMILPFNSIIHGIYRYVVEYMESKKFSEFFSINFSMLSVIFIGIYVMLWLSLQFFDFELKEYFYIISILVLSEVFKTMMKTIENARRYRKKVALSSLLEFMSKILLIIIFYQVNVISLQSILLILIIGNVLSIFGLMFNNLKIFCIPTIENYNKIFIPIVLFGIPLIFSQMFGWFRDMSNRWFLEIYVDSESVAAFALMATIASIVPNGFNSLIGSYLVPIIYQKEHSDTGYTEKLLKRIIPKLIFGSLLMGIGVYMFKDFIVILFSDEKYVEHSWMLPPMFVVSSFYVISMIASYKIYSKKKTKLLLYPAVLSAIVAFSSGYILIQKYGLDGAFISYLITYACYALAVFYIVFYKKVLHD
jgi:O-antigen/teichoic acid export membrane protein